MPYFFRIPVPRHRYTAEPYFGSPQYFYDTIVKYIKLDTGAPVYLFDGYRGYQKFNNDAQFNVRFCPDEKLRKSAIVSCSGRHSSFAL